jgi:hypothetical protein
MTFANPIALWLLSSLAVPVAIHLLSRKEGRVIRVGSIRHLQESSTRQFKSIRLNEVVLLLLRSVLLMLFIVLLAGPGCTRPSSEERWLILEAGVSERTEVRSLVDSLQHEGFETYAMDEFVSHKTVDYRELANILREKPVACVVIAHNYLQGFSGKQEPLPANIRWIGIEPDDTTFNVYITHAHDSLLVREGTASGEATTFQTRYIPATEVPVIKKTLSIGISASNAYAEKKRIIIAALRSIQWQYPGLLAYTEAETLSSKKYDWLINLTDQPMADTSMAIINLSGMELSETMVQTGKNQWELNRALTETQAREQNLPVHLLSILTSGVAVPAVDRRTIPTELAWRGQTESSSQAAVNTSAEVPILILILVVLIIERTLSFIRKQ